MVLDSKAQASRISRWVDRIAQKFLVGKISANALTLLGLLLGLISASLYTLTAILQLDAGFQLALGQFTSDLLAGGWAHALNASHNPGGLFKWAWKPGDTLHFIGLVFMLLSFGLDVFDGAVARGTRPTVFGGILDIFCDRTVEIALMLSIIGQDPLRLAWPGVFAIGSIVLCITIFLLVGGAVAKRGDEALNSRAKVLYYSPGLMERSETILFIFAMAVIGVLRVWLLWAFAVLVFFTAIQRLVHAYRIFHLPDSGS